MGQEGCNLLAGLDADTRQTVRYGLCNDLNLASPSLPGLALA